MEKVHEARRRSDRVRELLQLLGDERTTRPIATRCAGIFTPPLDTSPQAELWREELRKAVATLEELLTSDFRQRPE